MVLHHGMKAGEKSLHKGRAHITSAQAAIRVRRVPGSSLGHAAAFTHRLQAVKRIPLRFISWMSVVVSRAPEAPSG